MEMVWIIIAFIFAILGVVAAMSPIVPGPFIGYVGLLVFYFVTPEKITLSSLVVFGVLMIVASLADNIISPILVRRFGGSKKSSIGLLVGILLGTLFFPPWGMILGAFFGALLGEYITTRQIGQREIKIAFAAFCGFIFSLKLKLLYTIVVLIYMIWKV